MVDDSFPARSPLPKDLRVFHDVARALTSSLDLDSILGAIMQQMKQFFEPESWSLLIVDEEQKNLYYAVAAGKSAGNRNLRVDMREAIAGWVALVDYPARSLTTETAGFLRVLCDYAAIAIQNVRAVERIQELTITDDCTGLFNSRHLFSITEVELERSRRFNLPFS